MAQTVIKDWGFEQVICNNELYCAKFLHISPGKQCSLHMHHDKDETFYVLDGECTIETALVTSRDHRPKFTKGQSKRIAPGQPHRFASKDGAILLEVSTHHEDGDVFRWEPSGNIPGMAELVRTGLD